MKKYFASNSLLHRQQKKYFLIQLCLLRIIFLPDNDAFEEENHTKYFINTSDSLYYLEKLFNKL